jgi:hypothetical protein
MKFAIIFDLVPDLHEFDWLPFGYHMPILRQNPPKPMFIMPAFGGF